MFRYALRNLLQNKIRLVISVGGVALALSLILALDAIMTGVEGRLTAYIDHSGADVFVSQAGVRNLHMVSSWLPASVVGKVQAVPGVAAVTPIMYLTDTMDVGPKQDQYSVYVIGLPQGATMGGPWRVAQGVSIPAEGQAVIDLGVAEQYGLGIGDKVNMLVEAYQSNALRTLRDYAYAHSSFYQQFHQGLTDAPLHELPVLTKAMMMDHFDDLVTDRTIRLKEVKSHMKSMTGDERFLGRYRVNATSGSSGHPGIFLFNHAEWITVLASFARAREWGGVKLDLTHRVKTATVASTTAFHMSARVNATAHSWWMPEIRLAASEPIAMIVQRLNAWQPEVLIAYASMMRILADEQLTGRLQIRPRTVFTSSEVLTEQTRRHIVQAWGERLFNQYAATESGSLAAECDHHRGMHLMEDLVIVEVVDQDNRPVPPGVYGDKLLITVLFNHTQPLIRYELNDSVRLSPDPCPSGHPFALIDDIQGRVEDVLSFPGVAGGVVNVHPLVFSRVMDTLPVSGWQVVQETGHLRVLLSGVRGEFGDEMLADTLRQALSEQGAIVPQVEVQRVESIPKTPAGKAPLVKSNLSHSSQLSGTSDSAGKVKEHG